MTRNSKKYLVVAESHETTVVRHSRPIFRKVYCPHCGSDTRLFRRDDDEPSAEDHTLLCEHHRGEIGDGTESAAASDGE